MGMVYSHFKRLDTGSMKRILVIRQIFLNRYNRIVYDIPIPYAFRMRMKIDQNGTSFHLNKTQKGPLMDPYAFL